MRNVIGRVIHLDDETLYREAVISKKLECKEKTLQAWRSRGGGPPFVKIGRLVRYRGRDVKQWMDGRTVRSTSENFPRGAA